MTSRDLTGEQLDRLIRTADEHLAYYLRAWRRVQANDIPLDDPLAMGICETWNAVLAWRQRLVTLRERLPKLYRPLASPHRTSGLASKTQPWAERQRRAAAAVARHAARPTPPDPGKVANVRTPTTTPAPEAPPSDAAMRQAAASPPAPVKWDASKALPPDTDVFDRIVPKDPAEVDRIKAEFKARQKASHQAWRERLKRKPPPPKR